MLRNKRISLIIGFIIAMLVGANTGFSKTVSWKLGYGGAPNDPTHKQWMGFAKALEENSNGRFKLKVQISAPMGYGIEDGLRYLKQGIGESCAVAAYYVARDEPMLGVLLPHGVLLEQEENEKLFAVIKEAINKIYAKWDAELRGPEMFALMTDWVLISKEPITSLEQLKGKKIRHSDKIAMKALNELGVAAQFVPSSETYMALKTGVIDGAAYSRLFTLVTSLHEVTKYMSYMYPYSTAVLPGITVSKKAWAKLPKDLQDIFDKTAKEYLWDRMYGKWKSRHFETTSEAGLLKKGMKILKPFSRADRIKIQKATLKAWREECERIGPEAIAHYDNVTSIINTPK